MKSAPLLRFLLLLLSVQISFLPYEFIRMFKACALIYLGILMLYKIVLFFLGYDIRDENGKHLL